MKKSVIKRAGALFIFLVLSVSVLAIAAYANDIHTVEIWVDIHSDGSATIKETWDITMTNSSNTEWYVAKHNLDNMEIRDLIVEEVSEDGTLTPFETLSSWNINASRAQKAGKCGLVQTNNGYEICWGFGELSRHSYIVSYTITDIVKSYQGGDAMSYNFLSDTAGGAEVLNIYLNADDFSMEYPETEVWVFGCKAESIFTDGGITILGQGRFRASDYAAVLLAFEPGLFSPSDQRNKTIDEIIELNLEGSVWADSSESSSSGGTATTKLNSFMTTIASMMWPFAFLVIAGRTAASSGSSSSGGDGSSSSSGGGGGSSGGGGAGGR